MVAWARATYQYHVNGTDMVSRSVDARGPVDHTKHSSLHLGIELSGSG